MLIIDVSEAAAISEEVVGIMRRPTVEIVKPHHSHARRKSAYECYGSEDCNIGFPPAFFRHGVKSRTFSNHRARNEERKTGSLVATGPKHLTAWAGSVSCEYASGLSRDKPLSHSDSWTGHLCLSGGEVREPTALRRAWQTLAI